MKLASRTINTQTLVVSVLSVCVLALCLGCQGTEPRGKARKLFIVLLDETESFAIYKEKGVIEEMYWGKVIPLINMIVSSMEPGDAFGLIGIDERGFDAEDVRVPFEVLDEGFLKAKMGKDRLRRVVTELRRRKEKHRSTDILGSLYHAAYFAQREPDRSVFIFCFSDMKQEPRWPTQEEARELKFLRRTEGYFFHVNASGRTNWNRLVQVWEPILSGAGLEFHTDGRLDFYQKGESRLALVRILKEVAER